MIFPPYTRFTQENEEEMTRGEILGCTHYRPKSAPDECRPFAGTARADAAVLTAAKVSPSTNGPFRLVRPCLDSSTGPLAAHTAGGLRSPPGPLALFFRVLFGHESKVAL